LRESGRLRCSVLSCGLVLWFWQSVTRRGRWSPAEQGHEGSGPGSLWGRVQRPRAGSPLLRGDDAGCVVAMVDCGSGVAMVDSLDCLCVSVRGPLPHNPTQGHARTDHAAATAGGPRGLKQGTECARRCEPVSPWLAHRALVKKVSAVSRGRLRGLAVGRETLGWHEFD
jgi:hypothetical protein